MSCAGDVSSLELDLPVVEDTVHAEANAKESLVPTNRKTAFAVGLSFDTAVLICSSFPQDFSVRLRRRCLAILAVKEFLAKKNRK